jgi:hypothetical protein
MGVSACSRKRECSCRPIETVAVRKQETTEKHGLKRKKYPESVKNAQAFLTDSGF